ncbi:MULTISPECIES: hypothetical protein [Metabacillus]|uniref:Uncharacterized protein n=2 Tax=Metabacillus TaxID=2675233 RepID=A0A179T160_9BACI|nr:MULTISPECIES: hypothetical protein [Metabacillus]OAS86283.1 hypothetical protein A6K24_21415 [Metabacillus litoralis]QNF30617.1 hypothetical protein HUW50_26000 [Metabacillus sp. KUDC1714]
MSSILNQLGPKYFALDAARVDASPTEVIITNDEGNTYYIVTPDVLTEELLELGFKKVEGEE